MLSNRLDHPGLIFPDSPLHPRNQAKQQKQPKRKKKFIKKTISRNVSIDWGYTTDQISQKLGITPSAVRQYMHRHKIPHKLVCNPITGPAIIFWDKSKVTPLINSYPRPLNKVPEGFITLQEAKMLLNVSSTSLNRLCKRYKVTTRTVKLAKNDIWRLHKVYKRDSILNILKDLRFSGFFASPN